MSYITPESRHLSFYGDHRHRSSHPQVCTNSCKNSKQLPYTQYRRRITPLLAAHRPTKDTALRIGTRPKHSRLAVNAIESIHDTTHSMKALPPLQLPDVRAPRSLIDQCFHHKSSVPVPHVHSLDDNEPYARPTPWRVQTQTNIHQYRIAYVTRAHDDDLAGTCLLSRLFLLDNGAPSDRSYHAEGHQAIQINNNANTAA